MDNTQLNNIYEHNTNSNQPLEKLRPLVTLLNKVIALLNKAINRAIIF